MRKLMLIPLLLAGVSCSRLPELPPISDSGQSLPGKFVWRDLVTPNAKAAEAFYAGLLGWTFEPLADSGYALIRQDGQLVGGMVDAQKIGQPVQSALWLNALSVPDVKAAAKAAVKAGGRVIHPPRTLKGRGQVAVITDRNEAMVQLVQLAGGDPVDETPKLNQWLWTELITDDPADAVAFYQAVVGYDVQAKSTTNLVAASYQLLVAKGTPRAGVLENPFEETRSAWIPYIRVADVEKSVARAVQLGGQVVIKPRAEVRGGQVALLLDPSGAPVALQTWAGEMKGSQP